MEHIVYRVIQEKSDKLYRCNNQVILSKNSLINMGLIQKGYGVVVV